MPEPRRGLPAEKAAAEFRGTPEPDALKFLSAETMPLVIDDEVVRRFEVWSTTPTVLVSRRPWYVRMLRFPRAWIPGTLEWRFRRWVSRKQFVVSE
jgi:hypothetical protein